MLSKTVFYHTHVLLMSILVTYLKKTGQERERESEKVKKVTSTNTTVASRDKTIYDSLFLSSSTVVL